MKLLSFVAFTLVLVILGCNEHSPQPSSQPSSSTFDPCESLRKVDSHCGWKPHWTTLGEHVNKMDETRSQHVILEASDSDGVVFGTLHYPDLSLCFKNGVLCGNKTIGVGICGHTLLSHLDYDYGNYKTAVRIRFDDEKPSRQTWGISDNRKCLFPTGREKQFASELLNHKVLYVEFSYLDEAPQTVSFQLEGLQEMLNKEKLHI